MVEHWQAPQPSRPVVISTDDVSDRKLDYWRHQFGLTWGSVQIEADDPGQFHGVLETAAFGELRFNHIGISALRLRRNRKDSGSRDAPFYSLAAPRSGCAFTSIQGDEALLKPGNLYLIYNGGSGELAVGEAYETFNVQIPSDLLTQRVGFTPALREWPLNGGMARLVSHFVAGLHQHAPAPAADSQFLSGQLCDLIAFLLSGSEAGQSGESTVLAAHRRWALQYIDRHCDDPGLCPATIAAACGISPSYLYRVFATGDLTVMGEVRRARLRRARTMLASSRFSGHTVSEIGYRCGFRSPADFSRAFRASYGMSPSQCRSAAPEPTTG